MRIYVCLNTVFRMYLIHICRISKPSVSQTLKNSVFSFLYSSRASRLTFTVFNVQPSIFLSRTTSITSLSENVLPWKHRKIYLSHFTNATWYLRLVTISLLLSIIYYYHPSHTILSLSLVYAYDFSLCNRYITGKLTWIFSAEAWRICFFADQRATDRL